MMKFNRIFILGYVLFSISSSVYPMQWFRDLFKSQEQKQAKQHAHAQLQLQQATQQRQQTEKDLETRIATLKKEITGHQNEVQRLLQASQASRGSSLASLQLNRNAAKQQLSLQHLKEKSLRSAEKMLRILQSQSRRIGQVNPKKRKRDAVSSISGEDVKKQSQIDAASGHVLLTVSQPLSTNSSSLPQDSLSDPQTIKKLKDGLTELESLDVQSSQTHNAQALADLKREFTFDTSSNLSSANSNSVSHTTTRADDFNARIARLRGFNTSSNVLSTSSSSVGACSVPTYTSISGNASYTQCAADMATTDSLISDTVTLLQKTAPIVKKMAQEADKKLDRAIQESKEVCDDLEKKLNRFDDMLVSMNPHVVGDDNDINATLEQYNVQTSMNANLTSISSSSSSTESREQTIINALIRKSFSAHNAAVAAPMVAAYEELIGKTLITDEEIAEVALDLLK